jgi:hypothetical protein
VDELLKRVAKKDKVGEGGSKVEDTKIPKKDSRK